MKEMYWQDGPRWPETARKSIDYPREPLFAMLDRSADEHGDTPYTVFMGQSRTFAEVRNNANSIANFLISRGIQKGDKVAIFLPNTPHYPPIFFGILKAGAIVVTCNPQYKAGEFNYQLRDAGVKAVFAFDYPNYGPTTYEAVKGTDVEFVVMCGVKSFLPKIKAILGGLLGKIPKSPFYEEDKTFFYDDIISQFESTPPNITIHPDDTALILYTGGTTGIPKGAELTHYNLVSNGLQISDWIYLVEEDVDRPGRIEHGKEVFIGALPWYHSYGLTLTMLMGTWYAGQLICIPDPRAGKPPFTELLHEIQKTKGTVLSCVPALYAAIVNHPDVDKYDLTSIKVCGSGAAPLPPELAKRWEEVTGTLLFEGYGLTETSPVTHINPTNKANRRFGSIGLPMPDTICKIVDIETGTKELSIGETGEIAVYGPQVMKGYWNKPEETANVMREFSGKRFFLTGDIGRMDEEGYTYISDRKKDMVNVGGFKAYPREIEDIFYEHPKVKMAGVIGVPREDDPSNEFVKAFLVLKDGETGTPEEFIEWAKEKMAGYKRPREVELVEELPLSAVGKILRRELRREELEKRGME